MKKLELKHLCGYLPYGLKVLYERHVKEVHGLLNEEIYLDYNGIGTDMSGKELFEVEPLLLPLSALTDQMEDGSVPIVELLRMRYPDRPKEGRYSEVEVCQSGYPSAWYCYSAQYTVTVRPNDIQNTDFWIIEYLYANHFDIHNLIKSGLAIDKRLIK